MRAEGREGKAVVAALVKDSCSLGKMGQSYRGDSGVAQEGPPISEPRKKPPCPGCSEALALILGRQLQGSSGCSVWGAVGEVKSSLGPQAAGRGPPPSPVPWPSPLWPHKGDGWLMGEITQGFIREIYRSSGGINMFIADQGEMRKP